MSSSSIAVLVTVFALPLLAAKPAKPAKPVDTSAVFELLKQGRQLSAPEAADLETSVQRNPDDSRSRIKLLSFYAGVTAPADLEVARGARVAHIVWMIEHDPKSGFGLFNVATGVYRMHCQGDTLADPAGFERVAQAWAGQMNLYPKDDTILQETVRAMQYCKPEAAEKLLLGKRDAAALGRLYAGAVLGLNGEGYSSNDADSGASIPELRQGPFAKHAYEILDVAANADMLEAAASTMLVTGATLWADGKLDWDYTPFGNKLLLMARAAGAHSFRLLTLPTSLPGRGERPPMTIRVGGNMQAKNLVRKVTPRYPQVAKDQRISGTVRMNALIGLDGSILDLEVVSGPPELIDSSLQAVKQWQYKPTLLKGKPAFVLTVIDINYEL